MSSALFVLSGFCARTLIFLLICHGLSGCGLSAPQIKEIWDSDIPEEPSKNPKISGSALIEFEVKKRIYCELKDAVIAAQKIWVLTSDKPNGKVTIYEQLIPVKWGVNVTLSLQVDESTSLSPGLSANEVLPSVATVFGKSTVTTPQSANVGFGGTLSSTATRIDRFNPYYTIVSLQKDDKASRRLSVCTPGNDPVKASSSPLITSELGIKDWLIGAMYVNRALPSDKSPTEDPPNQNAGRRGQTAAPLGAASLSAAPGGRQSSKEGGGGNKPDTISIEIKFVIVSNGNVTPSWKLVRFSANTGNGQAFATGRTRTHDVIITVGPQTVDTDNKHAASVVGSTLSNAIRGPVLGQ
jgi:hypothetical protein